MEVVFVSSAFRHGYTKQDFNELLAADYLKIRSQRGIDHVYELLGRNLSGSYLHVVYRVLPNRRWLGVRLGVRHLIIAFTTTNAPGFVVNLNATNVTAAAP